MAMRPSWTKDLATMIANDVLVDARCPTCNTTQKEIDLVALAAIKGGDYDLWNRTTACRFTPGCEGRVHFKYMARKSIWTRLMGDDDMLLRSLFVGRKPL